jgi:phosphoserine phosphatase RsbU/P
LTVHSVSPADADSFPCGLLVLGTGTEVVRANSTIAEWLEYTPEELSGKLLDTLCTVATRIFLQTHFIPLLKLEKAANEVFLTLRSKSGRDLPVFANAKATGEDNDLRFYCAFFPVQRRQSYEQELLKARQRAEHALRNSEELIQTKRTLEEHLTALDLKLSELQNTNRELLRVSEILAHDLREPARKVLLFSELLQTEAAAQLTPESLHYLHRLREACAVMENVRRTILEYLTVDVSAEKPDTVDLSQVLKAAVASVEQRTESKLAIAQQGLCAIRGKPEQLHLLFFHLLKNSVKYRQAEHPPRIRITGTVLQRNRFRALQQQYDYVDFLRIEYEDNSLGFAPEQAQHVFNLLVRTRQSQPLGGIGLALCRKVVENHQGSIKASSSPGAGVRYTIELPVSGPAESSA